MKHGRNRVKLDVSHLVYPPFLSAGILPNDLKKLLDNDP